MELLMGVASSGRRFWRRNFSRSRSAGVKNPATRRGLARSISQNQMSHDLEQAVTTLSAAGVGIPNELLKHLSPLAWEHVVLTGEYRGAFDVARRRGQRRELRPTADALAALAGRTVTLPYRIPEMMS
jgi:hypothetical protein